MTIESFSKSVRILRIACPVVAIAAAAVCYAAWQRGSYAVAMINAGLFCINAFLTWVQWAVLKP